MNEEPLQFKAATTAESALPLIQTFLIEAEQDALLAERQRCGRDLLELGGKRVELLALLAKLSQVGGVGGSRQIVATPASDLSWFTSGARSSFERLASATVR